MKTESKFPFAALLLTTPIAAYADGAPHIELFAAMGGACIGGFIGALLACWLCNRRREQKDQGISTKS